jgi:hypothetical protein
MAFREIFLKLSVTFPDDPKVRALVRYGVDGVLARDLYVQMCLHCKRLLTDGFVASEQLGLLSYPLPPDHANQLAKQLAEVGLTKEVSNGWQVAAYLKRNGTKEDAERLSDVRSQVGRRGGLVGRKTPGRGVARGKRKQVAKQNVSKNRPETETETETETTSSSTPTATQASPKRGTRIPDDFTVTPDMVTWAHTRCPHVDGRTETEKFINYWQAKSGRDATKLDWAKTWRNWMLTAAERTGKPPNGHRPSTTDQRVAQAQELKTQLRGRNQL